MLEITLAAGVPNKVNESATKELKQSNNGYFIYFNRNKVVTELTVEHLAPRHALVNNRTPSRRDFKIEKNRVGVCGETISISRL